MIQDKIRELVQYGLLTGLVSAEDEIYTTNRLLELFRIEDYPYGFGEKIEQTEEEAVKRAAGSSDGNDGLCGGKRDPAGGWYRLSGSV